MDNPKTQVSIQRALFTACHQIQPVSESAALDAQVLLCDVLGVERAYLLAHPELPLSDDQYKHFSALVERCAEGEPLAYIRGRRAFYDREFIVSAAVLVPRPETELLLEQALRFVRQQPSRMGVVDVGTGSGALAVTLAALCPSAAVYASDISPAALDIARRNAAMHQVQVEFLQGDLLAPLIDQHHKVDLVMANLPYISPDELAGLSVARYEPRLALDGGVDGLELIGRLLQQAPLVCNPGAVILLEIGSQQGAAACDLARNAFPGDEVELLQDLAGLDRLVCIRT